MEKGNLIFYISAGLATLATGMVICLSGPKKSEPILKQIGSNEAKVYYLKQTQEIDGIENIDPRSTYAS